MTTTTRIPGPAAVSAPAPTDTRPGQALQRRLVTVETVRAIKPIPDADAIEVVQVRGWEVVVKKDDGFKVGDPVVYFEIDSALPLDDPRFEFLAARGAKTILGEDGTERRVHVLKTARLRGVYSQGLVMPLRDLSEIAEAVETGDKNGDEDGDLADLIGVVKYEPPLPAGSEAIAPFPGHLRTTDAERVQNIDAETWASIQSDPTGWVATEKVDGQSCTVWKDAEGQVHMAGRNWELSQDRDSPYLRAMRIAMLAEHLQPGEAIQGEVAGPGSQGNGLRLNEIRFVAFGFYSADNTGPDGRLVPAPYDTWPEWATALRAPVYDLNLPATVEEAIDQADGIKSLISPDRLAEGIVWTHTGGSRVDGLDGRHVWKAVSRKWLSKQKD